MIEGEERIISTLQRLLRSSTADESEALYLGESSGLTRFAASSIHQNMQKAGGLVGLRVVLDGRVGRAFASGLDPDHTFYALVKATEIARRSPPLPDFPGLPRRATYRPAKAFFAATGRMSAMKKAKILRKAFGRAGERCALSGSFNTSIFEMAVVNSKGLAAYYPYSLANAKLIATGPAASGYAAALSPDVGAVDFDELVDRALSKCSSGTAPVSVPPGRYDCILEPEAVADVILCMGDVSFGSRAFENGESILQGRIGKRVTGERVTIFDDPTGGEKGAVARPFDCEGVPAQKVMLIEKGIGIGVVNDQYSARRLGMKPTGHAIVSDAVLGEGGCPSMLCFAAGDASLRQMLSAVDFGLWVTKFNYVNSSLDPHNAYVTGTTRNGTFLIEKGRISRPVTDMRFGENILEAFSRIEMVSSERRLAGNEDEKALCPHLLVRGLRFIGAKQ